MWSKAKEYCTRRFPILTHLARAGTHLLWPGRCLGCKTSILPADDGLCSSCWQELSTAVSGDYCRYCGNDVSPFGIVNGRCGHCQDKSYTWDGLIRVGRYESTLRSVVLALKFAENTEWVPRLTKMMNDAVTAAGLSHKLDMAVPVPLHWRRRLSRGFNQAHLLARGIKLPGVTVSTDLVRVRYTEQQWNLTGPQRRRNVRGAFAVRRGHSFTDKSILLVDDISTSGATLTECAKTLKAAGAKTVHAAILTKGRRDT